MHRLHGLRLGCIFLYAERFRFGWNWFIVFGASFGNHHLHDTNPRHSSRAYICHDLQKAHSIIEFLFAFFYFTMRSFVAPVFFLHVTIQLLIAPSRHNISLGLRIVWILLIWAVEVGSYDWIIQCWDILQTYREGFGGNWPIQKEL